MKKSGRNEVNNDGGSEVDWISGVAADTNVVD